MFGFSAIFFYFILLLFVFISCHMPSHWKKVYLEKLGMWEKGINTMLSALEKATISDNNKYKNKKLCSNLRHDPIFFYDFCFAAKRGKPWMRYNIYVVTLT